VEVVIWMLGNTTHATKKPRTSPITHATNFSFKLYFIFIKISNCL
jgi:hypothetical protein